MSDSRNDREAKGNEDGEYLGQLFDVVFGMPSGGLPRDRAFLQLRDALVQIRQFVRCLADGNLSEELSVPGPIAGPLKSLRSSLKHMTWQAKEIASGDLSQRIDFLGEFSIAFNEMAERLDATLGDLRKREHELSETNASLRAAQAEFLEQATHDPLTGLLNRRSLAERWTAETARAHRNGQPITVLVADLDWFKSTNDAFGHEAGDVILVAFAETLAGELRQSDIACRLGGDEFAVLLPGTTLKDGTETANRIRDAFERTDVTTSLSSCPHTISIGAAAYPTHGETLEAVLRAADNALYQVKAAGRNRVVAAT